MKTRFLQAILVSVLIIACGFWFTGCCCCKKQATKEPAQTVKPEAKNQQTSEQKPQQSAQPTTQVKQEGMTQTKKEDDGGWEPMFDGQTLYGWEVINYPGKGEVTVKDGQIILGMGYMTGIRWTNEPPRMNYEVEYEAMRVDSTDFFGSLTFLVNTNPCTFILGGWGGGTVGISSLDDMDASENETSKFMNFENGKWYKVRVRVTESKIQVWINNEKIIDVVHKGRKVSLRPGDIELSAPFGFSTWSTTGALRNIRIRKVSGPE